MGAVLVKEIAQVIFLKDSESFVEDVESSFFAGHSVEPCLLFGRRPREKRRGHCGWEDRHSGQTGRRSLRWSLVAIVHRRRHGRWSAACVDRSGSVGVSRALVDFGNMKQVS